MWQQQQKEKHEAGLSDHMIGMLLEIGVAIGLILVALLLAVIATGGRF